MLIFDYFYIPRGPLDPAHDLMVGVGTILSFGKCSKRWVEAFCRKNQAQTRHGPDFDFPRLFWSHLHATIRNIDASFEQGRPEVTCDALSSSNTTSVACDGCRRLRHGGKHGQVARSHRTDATEGETFSTVKYIKFYSSMNVEFALSMCLFYKVACCMCMSHQGGVPWASLVTWGPFLSSNKQAFTSSNDDVRPCLATSLIYYDEVNKNKTFVLRVTTAFSERRSFFSCLLRRNKLPRHEWVMFF